MNRPSLVASAALCLTSLACKPPTPPRKAEISVEASHFSGSNGVEVYVLPDPTTSLIQVSVRYTVGSADDPPGKAGLAHLVEHLMFAKGRPGTDRTFMSELIRLGRYTNAYTTEDSTHYITAADPGNLEELFAIEVERMVTRCAGIDQATFDREREVVRNEVRLHFVTPAGRTHELIRQAVYPDGHPYRSTVGGDDEQLSAITLDDVCAFMDAHYQPHRAIFLIGGNTTAATATPIAQNWLTRAPAAATRTGPVDVPELRMSGATTEYSLPVEQPQLYVAWPAPPAFSAEGRLVDAIGAQLAHQIDGFNAEYHFASAVGGFTIGGAEAPVLVVGITLSSSSKRAEALEFVNKAKRWVERSFKHDDSDYSETVWEYRRTYQAESVVASVEPLGGRVSFFADAAQFEPEGEFLIGRLRELQEMDPGRISGLARSLLAKNGAVIAIEPDGTAQSTYRDSGMTFVPGQHEANRFQIEVDESEAYRDAVIPAALPAVDLERYELSNGLSVLLWSDGSLPLVRARLVTQTGTAHEPADRAGIADMSAAGRVGVDFTTYDARDLSTEVHDTIERLSPQVRGIGKFDIDELRRRMKELLGGDSYANGRELESKFNEAVYGPEHPYASTGLPTKDIVDDIGVDDVNQFFRSHYKASNSALIVTGSFDRELVKKNISAHFGHVSGKSSASKRVSQPAAAQTSTEYVVVRTPDAPLLTIRLGFPGASGVGHDYAARLILESVLGAKLRVLREELGITYGTSAGYYPRVGPGLWEIESEVDVKRAAEAMRAMMEVLDEMRADPESFAGSFVLARRALLQAYLSETRNSQSMIGQLAFVAEYDLDIDFRQQLIRRLATTKMSDISALIASELTRATQVVALMGPNDAVAAALAVARGDTEKPATDTPTPPE